MCPPRVSPSSSSSAGRWFLGRPGAFYPSCKPQSYPDNGTQISTNAMDRLISHLDRRHARPCCICSPCLSPQSPSPGGDSLPRPQMTPNMVQVTFRDLGKVQIFIEENDKCFTWHRPRTHTKSLGVMITQNKPRLHQKSKLC